MTERALILFAHGARDPAWAAPFQRLHQLVEAQLPDVTVRLAFLELMQPQLPELIEELAGGGCRDVTVVPVFLGQGGHVRRDLPLIVERLQEHHANLNLRVVQAAGEDAGVLAALATYCIGALKE
jgi:sirohydrochlorin cobaltochelatase